MNYDLSSCILCPRECKADRTNGKLGFCGATDTLYVAHSSLHKWEEPCISGENGSGTIFFSHCSLQCVYCQNYKISRKEQIGKPVTAQRLADLFLELEAMGAHNVNLVSATHYVPHIVEAIELSKKLGFDLPIIYNSSGYERTYTLHILDGAIDVYLPDFKYFSSYYSVRYSGAVDYLDCVSPAIDEMVRQTGCPQFGNNSMIKKGTVIRHLMLPGLLGDTVQILKHIAFHWGDKVLVSLMRQYTPLRNIDLDQLGRTVRAFEYEDACSLFNELGLEGFFQDEGSIGESFIPDFLGEGI